MPRNFFQSRSLKARVTAFTLVVFLAGTWSMAFYASRLLRDDMQSQLGSQQFSTASLLAEEVERELDDRLIGLKKLAGRITPAILNDTAVSQAFLEQQSLAQHLFNGGTWISRQDGIVIASNLPALIGTNYADREYMIAVLREGKSTISKPITGKVLKDPIFVMAVPIRDAQGKVIGALAGVTDLSKHNFLDSVTANTYGKTGGYLIVASQYRLIVTATDKSRVMEVLPAAGHNPSIDRFIDGYEGSDVLVNPFGVEVLVSAKSVPTAGWYVAAILPTAEAFAPIHALLRRMLLATLFLTLVVGSLTWWMTWRMLRRQLSPLLATTKTLATLSATALPPLPLPVTSQDEIGELIGGFNRLLESVAQREAALRDNLEQLTIAERERTHALRRIEALMKNSSDCVVVLDGERRIIALSDSCLSTYGYTREELLAMAGADLRAPDVREELTQRLQELTEKISLTYQTWHCRKDGSRFPVEIGASMIDIDGKRYFQFTIRDISQSVRQREAMEKELAATSRRLSELSHHLVEVQEDTRRRLAGELHDRTSPNLAAIQINLGIIATALPQDPPELVERLADTRALIEDADNSIRDISADLRSPLLDYAGLAAAVEAYAARFTQRTGIPVEFGCENGATRLAPALESLLFRIFQEALTNILKHARARSIKIMLNLDDSQVTLTVADDGVGFDLERVESGATQTGMGLLNMHEMAEFAGGTLRIDSHPGQGTRIEVRIQP